MMIVIRKPEEIRNIGARIANGPAAAGISLSLDSYHNPGHPRFGTSTNDTPSQGAVWYLRLRR